MMLAADAAFRLGPRALLHYAAHRARSWSGAARRALPDAPPARGPFLGDVAAARPVLPEDHAAAVVAAATAAVQIPADWQGPFRASCHALDLDLLAPGDVRPVWERSRLAALPLLAQAARLDPAGGERRLQRHPDRLADL